MNNIRRKKITSILADVEKLQQQMDNLPESLQDSERANAMACAVDNLDEARNEIESIKESLDNASGYLGEAKEG